MQKLIKYSLNIAKPEFILNPLSFILVFILYLLSFILFISCGKETPPAPPETQINLAHLDHLYGETVMNGDTVGFIVIYAEAPDYEWVVAPGEGLACVDDVARAAVVYLNDAQQSGNAASEQ